MTLDKIFAIADEAVFRKRFAAWRDKRWEKYGYDRLSEGEQRFVRIQGFCWEVNGNGFQGFFDNSHADMTHEIHSDLRLIGAKNAAALLKRAMGAFPNGKVPQDTKQRQDVLERALKKKTVSKLFAELNDAFSKSDPDQLNLLIWKYVREHPEHFEATEPALPKTKSEIKFGKPKRQAKLKDFLENPIWLSAQDVKGCGRGWEMPIVSPKTNVSQEVLDYSRRLCLCPIILFTIEGFTDYGIGQLHHDIKSLVELFLWVEGEWQDLDDLGTPTQSLFLVAVPTILGKKNVRFHLKKGKYFAVLAERG